MATNYEPVTNNIIHLNKVAATLWKHELHGQISDGMWENYRNSDWRLWCYTRVELTAPGSERVEGGSRNPRPQRKTSYRFSALKEYVLDRMLILTAVGIACEEFNLDPTLDVFRSFTNFDDEHALWRAYDITQVDSYLFKYAHEIFENLSKEFIARVYHLVAYNKVVLQKRLDKELTTCERVIRNHIRSFYSL